MDLEATFQQFCRSRDPAALGAVFDACADDLFGLALHLTRDHAMAEDVLQATFVCAIERAGRWQPTRPLRPWLLGILHREVKAARRRTRRAPDAARLAAARDEGPETVVLAAEVRDAVQRALVELPEPYRGVLDLHLVQTLPPAAIAQRLQRSSGSVRTQLWRGLELLRQRLPQGLAIGLAAAATAQAPFAAVRARVLAAAAGSGVVPAGATLALGILMKKGLLAAFVLLVGFVVWQLRWLEPSAAPAAATAGPASAVAASPGEVRDAREGEPSATDTSRSSAIAAPAPPTKSAVKPIELRVRVLDLAGAVVPGIEVEGFVPEVAILADGLPRVPGSREGCVRQFVATTDDDGRVRVTLTGPTLLSARKAGAGWSGDRLVRAGLLRLPDELVLVLHPTGTVRGRVLHADGRPAVGARVEASLPDGDVEILGPPAVVADAEGRFVLEGIAGADWFLDHSLIAVLGSEHSRRLKLLFRAGEVQEVELRFYGAFVVRGVLVDEHGAPSAGRVLLQGKPGTETPDAGGRAECGDDGRFEFKLDGGGSYWLVGGCEGKAPAVAAIEVDAARPERVVPLRMAPLVPVHGRVVDERGQPLAGRMVAVDPDLLLAELLFSEASEDTDAVACMRMQCDVLGGYPRPTSDADGHFHALLPPGWRCRALTAALPGSREFWSHSDPFLVPATDVQLVVRAQDAEGFVLTGRVVADADGTPIASAVIERVHHDDRQWSGLDVGRVQAGAFRIGPLARRGGASFAFTAEGYARTVVGPFDLAAREQDVVVRLPRCGSVRCRVLRANGTPAASAYVVLVRDGVDPLGPSWQGATDGEGWHTFDAVEPRALVVHAWASREAALADVEPQKAAVVVHPQQIAEVVVQLAR